MSLAFNHFVDQEDAVVDSEDEGEKIIVEKAPTQTNHTLAKSTKNPVPTIRVVAIEKKTGNRSETPSVRVVK